MTFFAFGTPYILACFGLFWVILAHFWVVMARFGSLLLILGRYGSFWVALANSIVL